MTKKVGIVKLSKVDMTNRWNHSARLDERNTKLSPIIVLGQRVVIEKAIAKNGCLTLVNFDL